MMATPTDDLVIVVTGASRGLGRGLARGFGAAGATVFVTGRTSGELDAAVEEIESSGGHGIAVPCDHSNDEQVRALFEQVAERGGKLDILVNNATAVDQLALASPGGFWEKPLHLVDMIDVGLRSSYVAAYYASPLMVPAGRGLIANISFYGAVTTFHGPAYGAAKAGTDKMTMDMAVDLAPHGVVAVSLWPGFILTDFIKQVPEELLPEDVRDNLPNWEHPEFSAAVLMALYADPELTWMSGCTLIGAELGRRYGITDLDGKTPIDYRASMGSPVFDYPTRSPAAG